MIKSGDMVKCSARTSPEMAGTTVASQAVSCLKILKRAGKQGQQSGGRGFRTHAGTSDGEGGGEGVGEGLDRENVQRFFLRAISYCQCNCRANNTIENLLDCCVNHAFSLFSPFFFTAVSSIVRLIHHIGRLLLTPPLLLSQSSFRLPPSPFLFDCATPNRSPH